MLLRRCQYVYDVPALLPDMTSAEHNDLMPAQEKLEWVTPKISLMEAGDTEGAKVKYAGEGTGGPGFGPS